MLERDHRFALNGNDLYVFDGGRYVRAQSVLRGASRQLLQSAGATKSWKKSLPAELEAYLAGSAGIPRLWPSPGERFLNLLNGLLDLDTLELQPHSPDHLTTVQLAVAYNPDASCPSWDAYFESAFPEDSIHVGYELVALAMCPLPGLHKSVMVTGPGSNGKSTLLKGFRAFLGPENYSSVPLHRLETDRFAVARLEGRLANFWDDLSSSELKSTAMLKSISAGDTIIGERKFKDSFNFTPFVRMYFACNVPPVAVDAGEAFFRRWYVLALDRSFTATDPLGGNELDRRLADPSELSGLLNRALAALPQVRARGIDETPSMREALERFRSATDPLGSWLARHTEVDPGARVQKNVLLDAYNAHARLHGDPECSSQRVGRSLRLARPSITPAQRRTGGRKVEVWNGIRLTDIDCL